MLSALSDDAVSAPQISIVHIAILILKAVGNGAATVVTLYLGSKRYLEAVKISALAVTLNLIIGLIMSVPEMGVQGAAISSVVSRLLVLLVFFGYFTE